MTVDRQDDQRGRLLFRNTLLSGASSLYILVVGLVVVPIHIDRLGQEAYGVWVLVVSFSLSGGFLSLADLGLQQSLVTFVAGAPSRDEVDRYVRSASAVFVGLTALALVGLAGLAWVGPMVFEVPAELRDPLRTLFWLLAVEAVVGLPALVPLGLLEGLQRYTWIRGAEVARQTTYAVATVGVLLAGGGLVAFAVAAIGAAVVGHAGFWLGARRVWGPLPIGRPDREAITGLRRFGSWLFVSKVSGTVWRQMDKSILSVLVTTTILTSYDVANKIQAAAASVLSFTSSALLPATAELAAAEDERRLRELMIRGTRYTVALSLPIVTTALLVAPELIDAWIGEELVDATLATRLFLTWQLFVGLATVALSMLIGLGHARVTALYGLLALAVNLAMSISLAPTYGLVGVVAATVVGYAVSTVLYLRLGLRVLHLRLGRFLRGAVLPLLPWTGALVVLTQLGRATFEPRSLPAIALVIAPGALTYAAGVWWQVFDADERAQLREYVGREA